MSVLGSNEPAATEPNGHHHLVGRQPLLAALGEVERALRAKGEPQTVFLAGRSGEVWADGKSHKHGLNARKK